MSSLLLLSRPDDGAFEDYVAALDVILPHASTPEEHIKTLIYELRSPARDEPITVIVRAAESSEEREWVESRGEGLYEVGFRASPRQSESQSHPVCCAEVGARMRFD